MSQKGRLRRLDTGVRWLETEGRYRHIASMMKCLEMLLDIADRRAVDPDFAADWDKHYPYIPLPPPRNGAPPPVPKREPAPPERPLEPAPVVVRQTPSLEVAPPHVEVSSIAIEPRPPPTPVVPVVPRPPLRSPEPPPPMPGMPTSPPSPDMEIRPVHWRQRGPQDYEDEEEDRPGTNGMCITEYDVLRDYDDDD